MLPECSMKNQGKMGIEEKLVEMMLDSFLVGLLVLLQTFQSGMV